MLRKCPKMFKTPPSTQRCVKSLQMCKLFKTHQKVQIPWMCIADQPIRVLTAITKSATKRLPKCASRDVEWNCSTNVLWAFHLDVFPSPPIWCIWVWLRGHKNRILMYNHLITQCCIVFLKSLYVILMYYGFVFMAFSNSLPCFSHRHRFLWLFWSVHETDQDYLVFVNHPALKIWIMKSLKP